MADIYQQSFWDDELDSLAAIIVPAALTILFKGGMGGEKALPKGARILMDWDWFNQAAIDWLKRWQLGNLRDFNELTRRRAVQIIADWVRAGEPLPLLEAKLAPLFGEGRARRVAVTEVTRMYAEGNILAWRSTGVVGGKRWRTANDEKVCPICGPLDDTEVGLDENGFTTAPGEMGLSAPPAHPNCRCWLQPVVSEEDLRKQLRNYKLVLRIRPGEILTKYGLRNSIIKGLK